MQESADSAKPSPAASDAAKSSDATALDEKAVEVLNKVVHAALTKRLGPWENKLSEFQAQIEGLKKPAEPAKDSKNGEMETLRKELLALRQENEAKEKRLQEKEITSHISNALSKHSIQMPQAATKLLKEHFQYDGSRVLAKDQYGEEIETDKVIERFLTDNPGFRPARNASGTAERGGGGSRPNLSEIAENRGIQTHSRDDLIKIAGDEGKARKLGWI